MFNDEAHAPEWDVAIVGCGPVGALAANLLATRGLRTVIVEREADPYPLPRAVHLDHEMMRLFGAADLLDRLEPLMFATDGHIHIGADGGVIRYLGSAGLSKPFHFSNDYFFYQPELEEALRAAIARFDHAEVRLGTEVTDVREHGDHVILKVRQGSRSSEISSRFVIGCDGARSVVRKAIGVRLDDLRFEEPWLVVDAEVEGPIQFPAFGGVPPQADLQRLSVMLCDPRRPATVVPGRGNHRRWEFMLLPGESDEEMMEPERVAGLLAPWLGETPHRVVRAATYRFHGLVAGRWQVGRVFLAGDAAHQTPPFFGQGMCHGLRDVANLVWKLDLTIRGEARPELLATYQPERDPHVRSVIGAAVDAGRYICELDPELARERDQRLRSKMAEGSRATAADLIPPIAQGVVFGPGNAATGTGVRFVQPLVSIRGARPIPLDEATGGGWTLLAQSEADSSLSARAREVWTRLGGKTFVLGQGFSDVEGLLAEWLRSHGANAVIVRPDFYTYGVASERASTSELVEALARDLFLMFQPEGALTR